MVRIFGILLCLIIHSTVNAQLINDSLLITLYNQSLNEYKPFYVHQQDQENLNSILVKTQIESDSLVEKVGQCNLVYLSSNVSNFEIAAEEPTRIKIFSISHSMVNHDTINVYINHISIVNENEEVSFMIQCGGTFGELPTFRFTYNNENMDWEFMNREKLIENRIMNWYKN